MFEVYVSKTLKSKNQLIGTSKNVYDAIEMGASHPEAGYFSVYDCDNQCWVNVNEV